jgi:flagellar hook assembly protein FlgD
MIYDVAGRRVAQLANAECSAGPHALQWNGRDGAGRPAAPGVYFYRIEAGKQVVTRKVLLVR